jgi:3-phenylpropionate/cinnamic acid dioxygenase small subunit
MISNVSLLDIRPDAENAAEVTVASCFLVYQNRVEYETNTFVGRRTDVLRLVGGNWKIARREIVLDQNVLMAKNLSTFF